MGSAQTATSTENTEMNADDPYHDKAELNYQQILFPYGQHAKETVYEPIMHRAKKKMRERGANHVKNQKTSWGGDEEQPITPEQQPCDPNIDNGLSLYMKDDGRPAQTFFLSDGLCLNEADYYAIFRQLDIDRVGAFRVDDGDLTKQEIEIVLRRSGLRKKQLMIFFDMCANDADGCITYEEFKTVYECCSKQIPLRMSERIFLCLEEPACCVLAKYISLFVTALILLSTIASVLESLPQVYSNPFGCGRVQAMDHEHMCVPTMPPAGVLGFYVIETFCVLGFTIGEYRYL
jgi:hypothetical protein